MRMTIITTTMGRLSASFSAMLFRQFKRREWTANRADPTAVVSYKSRYIEMIASWGVEAHTIIRGRKRFRSYDHWLFKWLYGLLEDTYSREQESYFYQR
jgi:hypothetical protein